MPGCLPSTWNTTITLHQLFGMNFGKWNVMIFIHNCFRVNFVINFSRMVLSRQDFESFFETRQYVRNLFSGTGSTPTFERLKFRPFSRPWYQTVVSVSCTLFSFPRPDPDLLFLLFEGFPCFFLFKEFLVFTAFSFFPQILGIPKDRNPCFLGVCVCVFFVVFLILSQKQGKEDPGRLD